MASKSQLQKLLPEIVVALIVLLMVWLADAVQDKEVIFPEIAAIATGALLSPKYAWKVSKKRIFALLLLCGVLGMGIVYLAPLPLADQMMIAAVLSQFIYLYSRTTFAPLVSAIVLPVLLQSKSVWYLISLVLFTSIILVASLFIEKNGIRPVNVYEKTSLPERSDFLAALFRGIVMCLMIAAALHFGVKFAVAPPLLVAFTEFCKPGTRIRSNYLRFLLLMTGCAVIGSASRYLITVQLGIPLYIAAVIAIVVFFLVLRCTSIYLPPAGAMVLLAMLIPEESVLLYPLQIFLGTAVFIGASLCYAVLNKERTHS